MCKQKIIAILNPAIFFFTSANVYIDILNKLNKESSIFYRIIEALTHKTCIIHIILAFLILKYPRNEL